MTGPAAFALGLAGMAALADWVAVARGRKRAEYIAKPLTLALVVAAALALHPLDATQRAWFVVALVASLAGDVFLMLPGDRLVPGLASFLVAHLLYVAGLRLEVHSGARMTVVLAIMAVVSATVGARIIRSLRRAHRDLVVPVAAYMVVITVMVATALATGDTVAATAALLFYVSDATIAEQRFVAPRRAQPVAIMVTYHAAQVLFVLSLLR